MRKGEWTRALNGRPPVFIGDELTASGFRLAGIHVHTPSDEQLLSSFRRALAESDLLLINVDYARKLPTEELRAAIKALSPLVLIVPDIAGTTLVRDLQDRLHRELGVDL